MLLRVKCTDGWLHVWSRRSSFKFSAQKKKKWGERGGSQGCEWAWREVQARLLPSRSRAATGAATGHYWLWRCVTLTREAGLGGEGESRAVLSIGSDPECALACDFSCHVSGDEE